MTTKCLALLLWCWFAVLPAAEAAPGTRATPFTFEPLGVANPCFVDSVRFADTYLGGRKAEGAHWVRVLRWGMLDDDYAMGPGHAVAVFQWRGGLFVFDINYGVRKLDMPVAQREDLRLVAEAVYSLYPKIKPIGPASFDDSWTTRAPGLRGADDGPITPAYRDAYRVAKTLAQQREVRIVRFNYRAKGKTRESAAAVFLFSRRLCVYVPERGTQVLRQMIPTIDDDGLLRVQLQRIFGAAAQVRLGPVVAPTDKAAPPLKERPDKEKQSAPVVSPAPSAPPSSGQIVDHDKPGMSWRFRSKVSSAASCSSAVAARVRSVSGMTLPARSSCPVSAATRCQPAAERLRKGIVEKPSSKRARTFASERPRITSAQLMPLIAKS